MNKQLTNRFYTVSGLILLAALTRLMPHYPNFTAVGAIALFGGATFTRKWEAWLVPFAAMFITDLIIGLHGTMIGVYAAFALVVLIGMQIRKKLSVLPLFLASVSASVVFFVITNFAMWSLGTLYPHTPAGLAQCFAMAVPFFHSTLLGDLFFTAALFGAYAALKAKQPKLIEA
jgi:hypothetical protein